MKRLLLTLLFTFSTSVYALAPVDIVFKTNGSLSYKRQRIGYNLNETRKVIHIKYYEWIEDAEGDVTPRSLKSYKLDGSYYFELSLASSGTTPIGDFLDSLIDARLGSTADEIQASIEVGRSAKDAAMVPFGYVP